MTDLRSCRQAIQFISLKHLSRGFWYDSFHKDLQLSTVIEFVKTHYQIFYNKFQSRTNHLINNMSLNSYPSYIKRRLKSNKSRDLL